jgi:hypothetical protein
VRAGHGPALARFATSDADGNNGVFMIPQPGSGPLRVVASDGEGWEHVSVSLPSRCPTWEQMCLVKAAFWDDEDAVMELHAPRSSWVNNHQFCLHLWRPVDGAIPLPPSIMVGVASLGVLK